MAAPDIDTYLAGLDDAAAAALQELREDIRALLPGAQECISYGMPAFKVDGATIAGFAAFKNHLAYLPHSGSVLPALAVELDGYESTKGSLHFSREAGLPKALVARLIDVRRRQLAGEPLD